MTKASEVDAENTTKYLQHDHTTQGTDITTRNQSPEKIIGEVEISDRRGRMNITSLESQLQSLFMGVDQPLSARGNIRQLALRNRLSR
jgi:hypothetical protein